MDSVLSTLTAGVKFNHKKNKEVYDIFNGSQVTRST